MNRRTYATTSAVRFLKCVCRLRSTNIESVRRSHLSRTFADGCSHVTSLNVESGERCILRLKLANVKSSRLRSGFTLPDAAIEGLKNALVQCSRLPKQLQHEADQLNEMLSQRRFPATSEEVREARNRIRKMLREEEGDQFDEDLFNQKVKDAKEDFTKRQVEKLLRRTRYNWRPLDFGSKESAAVYTLARLAANFAEVRSVLSTLEETGFVPRTVLDYGSGCGGAFWAAYHLWGDQVEEFQLIEPNDNMSKFCMDVLRGADDNPSEALVHRNVTFRRYLAPSPSNTFDVVIAHRILVELASRESRIDLINSLWNRANKYLVLIDSNLDDSFKALMEARDYILIASSEVHATEMRQIIHEMNLPNANAIEKILDDKNLSNYERFSLLRDLIPPEIELPTRLPAGFVFAPCPHDQGCPKLSPGSRSVCEFSMRWRDVRADGKVGKRRDGTATGSFSYVIMQKGVREPVENLARLLHVVHSDKHLTCTVCTPFIGIQRFVISKRAGPIYKSIKAKKPGQLLPITVRLRTSSFIFFSFFLMNGEKITSVASESHFDVYEEAVKEFERTVPSASS
ncbi:unnamed protein product [Toxocara canis]|uniref:Methyltransferase-like protein 17, mitochondrial n=1 Tax=Toxocara canis TaxID=6265 RepID=A0A183UUG3_TOXCA|nr:unnamed protein product [Toxocara canis]